MNTYHSNCDNCGTPIEAVGNRRYCSAACRRDAYNRRRAEQYAKNRAKTEIAVKQLSVNAYEFVRIMMAIADETGSMPSYGKVSSMIERGEIDPIKYLKRWNHDGTRT